MVKEYGRSSCDMEVSGDALYSTRVDLLTGGRWFLPRTGMAIPTGDSTHRRVLAEEACCVRIADGHKYKNVSIQRMRMHKSVRVVIDELPRVCCS